MNKESLIDVMNCMDFMIHDVGCVDGHEMVAKKCKDGRIVWWRMENEGSGFEQLFKGTIRVVSNG